MTRKFRFTQNTYYHLCNRSNDGNSIFFDERDYIRFLFFALAYQAPFSFYNIGRQTSYFLEHSQFNIPERSLKQIVTKKNAGLIAFAVMPNHFHFLVREKTNTGTGIPRYLQRVQTGYAKYFNAKYEKRGHLFQGPFRAVPVETNDQLLYLSAYIHRNPRDLKEWRGTEATYPWSSYQDFIGKNRWGELLEQDIVLHQFSHNNTYRKFLETSTAKLQAGESPIEDLLLE